MDGTILKIADPDARKIVMEMDFGNVSIALLELLSVYQTYRMRPTAIAGVAMYGCTDPQQMHNKKQVGLENIATASRYPS
jgi:hypothetical protein